MKKGYTLTEMLVVLAIMAALATPLNRLSKVVLYDIPRSMKLIECNTSILDALQYIRKDVNSAVSFPKSDEKNLVIEQNAKTVCYLFGQGTITRTETGSDEDKIVWQIPAGKIEWRICGKDGRGYAVEIKKYVAVERHNATDKRMENSYVFFAGAFGEEMQ